MRLEKYIMSAEHASLYKTVEFEGFEVVLSSVDYLTFSHAGRPGSTGALLLG